MCDFAYDVRMDKVFERSANSASAGEFAPMATQQWNPLTDMPNLKGKVAVVTGGSTGIGFETAKLLAQKGAKVYLTTRNQTRARQARDKIIEDTDIDPNNVQHLVMDLYDPESITAAVDELKKKEKKLHILSMV
ncbi:hypothetical protein ACHAPJ_011881 [Fusarium lateritium]